MEAHELYAAAEETALMEATQAELEDLDRSGTLLHTRPTVTRTAQP
ncbi:hypothetical protein [Nonomuraea sediminis]|nr:hypothetical protein [Nonomuraea sediminis]